jgi:hypothetical protein
MVNMKYILIIPIILIFNIQILAECVSGNCVNGSGVYQYLNGSKYNGYWENSKRNGIGSFYHAGGMEYHGNFKDDKPHGEVLIFYPDGRRKKAIFSNGRTIKFIRIEDLSRDGDLTYGEFDISGKYTGWYKGDAVSGYKPHGKGSIKFKTGSRYEGSWFNGRVHGRGLMTWDNGSKYEGEWDNGKRSGYGTYFWPDSSKYEGAWQENKRNGYGIFTSKNGIEEKGIWKDDVLVNKKGAD